MRQDTATISVEQARSLYEQAGGGHDFDHVLRVLDLADRVARSEGADLDIVRTAALLHDVGESAGRSDHHIRGAAIARRLLRDHPADFVDAVAHAIEAHRFRAEPEPLTLEARVLSDADKLDAIGAVGIARVFAYAGARGTALWRDSWRAIAVREGDAIQSARELGPDYTPVHEFVYKLDKIPERLYTSAARRIASERQTFMRAFFERLDQEILGELTGERSGIGPEGGSPCESPSGCCDCTTSMVAG